MIHLANYQSQVAKYFNKRVKQRSFKVGKLVLKRVVEDIKDHGAEKFKPVWEGLFEVVEAYSKGAYRLQNIINIRQLPRPWNTVYLKKYYV